LPTLELFSKKFFVIEIQNSFRLGIAVGDNATHGADDESVFEEVRTNLDRELPSFFSGGNELDVSLILCVGR
jgi:hypothetical protein